MPITHRIDLRPLATIEENPLNSKNHDEIGIAESISEHGLAELPMVDDRTGWLEAGHGRIQYLRVRKAAGDPPPDGVQIGADGDWLVPVLAGWASRDAHQAERYLIASNQLTINGGWKADDLAQRLTELAEIEPGLLGTGYSAESLEELLASVRTTTVHEHERVLPGEDEIPDLPVEPVTKRGDIWLLGPHRLMCGDSTDKDDLALLMDRGVAECMWTDPPYGVSYVGKTGDALTIEGDGAEGLPGLLAAVFANVTQVLEPGSPVYVAHPAGGRSVEFTKAFLEAGWQLRQSLIWVKNAMVLGHSDYHFRHEPILYGFTPGGQGRLGRGGSLGWFGDHSATSVFEFDKPSRSESHPTMKPVGLVASMLRNSCPPGGVVLDPFCGSGSTILACETTGRIGYGMEISPAYSDVVCARFERVTGIVPRKA